MCIVSNCYAFFLIELEFIETIPMKEIYDVKIYAKSDIIYNGSFLVFAKFC